MFVYCLNSPINSTDTSGFAGVGALSNTRDGVLRESGSAGLSGNLLAGLLATVSLVHAFSSTKEKVVLREEPIAVADAVSFRGENVPAYYGADLYGGSLSVTTPAMTFDDAVIWAISTASSNIYSDRAGWGLYTYKYADAFKMAITLSPIGPVSLDPAKGAHRAHFHTVYRHVAGVPAQSFHIWFG